MRNLFTIFFLFVSFSILSQTVKDSKTTAPTGTDIFRRLIINNDLSSTTKLALISATDTTWFVSNDDTLNIITPTLLHNGSPITSSSSIDTTFTEETYNVFAQNAFYNILEHQTPGQSYYRFDGIDIWYATRLDESIGALMSYEGNIVDETHKIGYMAIIPIGDSVMRRGNYNETSYTGTWSGDLSNYTQTALATVTYTFEGNKVDFFAYHDDRGGIWEFKLDGTVIDTFSVYDAAADSGRRRVIAEELDGTVSHTVIGRFLGDDPDNVPSGGAGTSRGWMYVNSNPPTTTREAFGLWVDSLYIDTRDVSRQDLYRHGPNKELAFRYADSANTFDSEWFPYHGDPAGFDRAGEAMVVKVDGVIVDTSAMDGSWVECDDLAFEQKTYGVNFHDGLTESDAYINYDSYTTYEGVLVDCELTVEVLKPINIVTFYDLMTPVDYTFRSRMLSLDHEYDINFGSGDSLIPDSQEFFNDIFVAINDTIPYVVAGISNHDIDTVPLAGAEDRWFSHGYSTNTKTYHRSQQYSRSWQPVGSKIYVHDSFTLGKADSTFYGGQNSISAITKALPPVIGASWIKSLIHDSIAANPGGGGSTYWEAAGNTNAIRRDNLTFPAPANYTAMEGIKASKMHSATHVPDEIVMWSAADSTLSSYPVKMDERIYIDGNDSITTNIASGTTAGQMPYWDGTEYTSATGLAWDNSAAELTLDELVVDDLATFDGNIGTAIGSNNYIFGSTNFSLAASGTNNFIVGLNNLENADHPSYNFAFGFKNGATVTSSICTYNFFGGYKNAENATYITSSFFLGYNNGNKATSILEYNFLSGRFNAYNVASRLKAVMLMGEYNAYTTTGNIYYSLMSGLSNAKMATGAIYNSVLIGNRNADSATTVYNTIGIGGETFMNSTIDLTGSIAIGYQAGKATTYTGTALFGVGAMPTANDQVVIGGSGYTGGILLDEDVDFNGDINVSGTITGTILIIPPLAAAPSTPVLGQIYFNTSDDKLYMYDGSAWQSWSKD